MWKNERLPEKALNWKTQKYTHNNMYVKIVRTHVSHLKNLYFSQPNFEIVRVPSW